MTDMTSPAAAGLGTFERWLSVWVALAIGAGLLLGNLMPGLFGWLAGLEVASVNLPVAVLIWAMVYPMMVGVDFGSLARVGEKPKGLIITLVVNNGMFGTIRMHQERNYPGRVSGTELHNPDFAAYAKAFGGYGETVTKTEDFGPAFDRAVASGKPAILEIQVDPQALTPVKTLDQIRAGKKVIV